MNTNKITYLVIAVLVLFLSITSATYSYLMATATNNSIVGDMANLKLDLDIEKITHSDEEKGGIIPMSNNMVEVAINNNCVDNNGNAVCQIYKTTVKNTGSTNLFVDGYITLTGGSGVPADYIPTKNKTTMRWAQVFCDENDTNCTTIGNTTTGATGIETFTTLDNQADTTGLNQTNIKTNYSDIIQSGTIQNKDYNIINKNYIRVSDRPAGSLKFNQERDVSSALVYNQYLDSSTGTNPTSTYYFVVWLSENGQNQTQIITDNFFGGVVAFISSGGNITGTFGNFKEVAPKVTKSYLKAFTGYRDKSYFHNETYRNKIKNISFVDYIDSDNSVINWDVSDKQDKSIIAWLTNNEVDGYYDLYIGSNNTISAKDLNNYFYDMRYVDSIKFDNLDTSKVTNMGSMFESTGYSSPVFTLDLGENFDTSEVTNMGMMFYYTGYSSPVFTLDLGENFDTSEVTDMNSMFRYTGYSNPVFTLDLGNKFDTSNVTNMSSMFYCTGYSNTAFTLDLGENFDTSKVTKMYSMFLNTGYNSIIFTLNLGDKFDTLNVTDMEGMFYNTGYSNSDLILDLSSFTFDKVVRYNSMFYGFSSTKKIYVKNDTDKQWIIEGKKFTGATSSNVLIKGE